MTALDRLVTLRKEIVEKVVADTDDQSRRREIVRPLSEATYLHTLPSSAMPSCQSRSSAVATGSGRQRCSAPGPEDAGESESGRLAQGQAVQRPRTPDSTEDQEEAQGMPSSR